MKKRKKEYLLKLEKFEEIKAELAKGEKEGNLTYDDRKRLARFIDEVGGELKDLNSEIKEIASKNSEIVTDPRYSQIRFENMHGNPDASDS